MRVDLLKHNQEAYEKVQKVIKEGKKKIAIAHATGTGKSYLVTKLFEDFSNDKKLVLVPSTYISEQIQKLFDKYEIQNADIMLYQRLIKMSDEDIAAMDYDVIALDEYHHNTSKVWGNKVRILIESHSESIIFGTSATPVRSDGVNTIDELFEGNCASDLPLSESIARKIVPLPRYVGALYTLDDELEKLRQKVENATNTKDEKQEFYKKIDLMRSQIEKSYGMPIILNKHIKDKEGKFIVFCKKKKHLKDIKETVIDWFKTAGCKKINVYEVYSDYENRNAEYKAFCADTSHALKLLFCVDMLNEGLHLKNISGVLLLRPTKSSIVWYQQIGRAIEANNTNTPVIIDAVNNFSAVGQGMKLLREIKDVVAKEKESDPDFDDSGFVDIDTFFVLEQVIEIQEMFKEIEEKLQGDWENGLKHFDKYVREHDGDVLVLGNYKDEDGFLLGNWVSNKRQEYKNNVLLPKRVEELNKRSFIWDVKKYEFALKLETIKRFVIENGRLPKSMSKNPYEKKLGGFLIKERMYYKQIKEQYPKWRKDAMEGIEGFSWDLNEEYFLLGCKYYEDYISRTGSISIPKGYCTADGFNLSSWVSSQKNKYRMNKLTNDEKNILNRIGFSFSVNNDNFDKQFKLLEEYMEVNHCDSDIPQATIYKGEKLGNFVSRMRASYKNETISDYRKRKLESIGFIWNVYEKQWNNNLEWFSKYKKEHGGKIDISKNNQILKSYYYWLIDQRMLYRKGQMREDRKILFEQVIMS